MNDDSEAARFESLTLRPIGVIRTDLHPPAPTPGPPLRPDELRARTAAAPASHERGHVEVFEEVCAGLADVEDCERLYLIFWLHQSTPPHNLAPFAGRPRDVFATHSPSRPNPVELTSVRLIERHGRILVVEGVDTYDGTPLLDIKPYVERGGIRTSHATH
jgi:tRNA-Thr(GGU) m(6)t(6)A37 methyltransferase TsaA